MKKVSIVIPMFNAEKCIEATLQSVLMQTWANKEILVVDDGSTDQSVRIVECYGEKGVTLLRQQNKGACAARNLGFLNATGDYIQFLDADDILHINKIQCQMLLLQEYDKRVIASSTLAKFTHDIDQAKFIRQTVDHDYSDPKQWLIDSWEGKGKGQTSLWLCHRNVLQAAGKWDESLRLNQDGEYFCRVLLKADSIKFCPEAIVYYRTGNADSISQGKSYKKAVSLLDSYISYQRHILVVKDSFEIRHGLMRNFLAFIYEYYPLYPDLLKAADQNIRGLGFKTFEPIGGKNFQRLVAIFGFYTSLRIRNLLQWK